jgi:SAM-dependent methyltransferase
MQTIETLLDGILRAESLISVTLSEATGKAEEDARKVTIRPLLLRNQRLYQFEYRYAQKVKHENLKAGETKGRILELLAKAFRQGYFYTTEGDFHAAVTVQGKITIRAKDAAKAAPAAPLGHDRQKNYLLPEDAPIDFLVRLGVMTAAGKVAAAKRDKFKQINRFLEMVDDVFASLPPSGPLKIIDFGCGKAYLTFALYYYLTVIKQKEVQLVGLDLKQDVVEFCSKVALDLGYAGLTFAVGDIEGYQQSDGVDMVVTLHACDTATDDALIKAVAWNARVILSVPCCQHELFKQLESDILRPLLKHGILKERLTALVTDSVRASLLESAGYSVQILEFIALEHTAKNLLIRAVKRPGHTNVKPPTEEYEAFRDFWHIHPHMEAALEALTHRPGNSESAGMKIQ